MCVLGFMVSLIAKQIWHHRKAYFLKYVNLGIMNGNKTSLFDN